VLGSRRRDRLRDHARRPVRAPDPTQACTKTSFCSAGGVSRPNVIDSGSRPLGTSRIVEQVWGTRRFVRRRSTLTDNRGASLRAAFLLSCFAKPASRRDDYRKPISEEKLARREAGEPVTHRFVRFAHVSRRSERLLGPPQGLLLDG
jgi:hypothetical protein